MYTAAAVRSPNVFCIWWSDPRTGSLAEGSHGIGPEDLLVAVLEVGDEVLPIVGQVLDPRPIPLLVLRPPPLKKVANTPLDLGRGSGPPRALKAEGERNFERGDPTEKINKEAYLMGTWGANAPAGAVGCCWYW